MRGSGQSCACALHMRSMWLMVMTRLAALWHAQASAAGGEALARLASARAVLQKRATRLDQQCAPVLCSLFWSMPNSMASASTAAML